MSTGMKYFGLDLALTFDPPDRSLSGDELIRFYARAFREGMRGSDRWNQLRAETRLRRLENPDAEVTDVIVRLADGNRTFTWDEFDAWLTEDDA